MKKQMCWALAAATVVVSAWSAMAADPPKSVRIGYAISLSGQNAQGAAITTLSGYKLWVDDVNKKGGLKVQGFDKRIPIEVTEYDDTSNAETMVRLTERLMTQDKVDFVLPPWSTGFNLAAAPIYARNGYPQLAVTANSNDAANLVKQMPTLFFFLNEPRNYGAALVEVLGKLKSENKINNKIVMFSVADQFGAEASAGITPVLQKAGFEIVVRKSYPLGAADLTNEIKEAKASGADTFLAYSYPPDTFMLTNTAITQSYNPEGVLHRGRHGVRRLWGELQGEGRGRLRHRRLGSDAAGRAGLREAHDCGQRQAVGRLGRAGDVREPAGARTGHREGRPRPQEAARCLRQWRTVPDDRRPDRSQDPHPRQAVGRRPVAERPVRRRLAGRPAGCEADRLSEAGMVSGMLRPLPSLPPCGGGSGWGRPVARER